MQNRSIAHIVWFSIIAAVLTISIKSAAYFVTGSVGFLSDAMESLINLVAAVVAFISLTIAARPADSKHPFGHDKAEYFSSIIEGLLIVVAAIGIIYTAINRFFNPVPLQELNAGMALSVLATLINLGTSRIMLHYGKKHNSITLEADGHHLMTDVWTTVGIIAGILLVKVTNWLWLDPVMAMAVGLSIIYTGSKLIVRSTDGLMDTKISEKELVRIKHILDRHKQDGIEYHALYTRQAASKRFIRFHLLFPDDYTVRTAHEVTKLIEADIAREFPLTDVFIHIEPLSDQDAFNDHLTDADAGTSHR